MLHTSLLFGILKQQRLDIARLIEATDSDFDQSNVFRPDTAMTRKRLCQQIAGRLPDFLRHIGRFKDSLANGTSATVFRLTEDS